MLHALVVLAVDKVEPSKTAFYVVGGAWAAWAVILGVLGSTRPDFPGSATVARGIMAGSGVLMVGAMAAAVLTS